MSEQQKYIPPNRPIPAPYPPGILFLGMLEVSEGAEKVFRDNDMNVWTFLYRHLKGDWGQVSPEWIESNNRAIHSGDLVRSVYTFPDRQDPGRTHWISVLTDPSRERTRVRLIRPETDSNTFAAFHPEQEI